MKIKTNLILESLRTIKILKDRITNDRYKMTYSNEQGYCVIHGDQVTEFTNAFEVLSYVEGKECLIIDKDSCEEMSSEDFIFSYHLRMFHLIF